MGLTTPHNKKNKLVKKQLTEPWTWTGSLDKQPKQWNMDTRSELDLECIMYV
jgi:hypothetical protein